ncbi:NUDIX hydrolase [Actinorhabdospora filicis]|uniref:NUDIX hydrolase n=1 Tax=Actinorhabdospora filicis TaxID=1785913 RepID=A0A9W6SJW6_9ACTN|nr:NUDIX hydrolase [Actinorhabdospora filicis]GLZ78389.1 NUDIX hydrolase [Actinorhabdospora filicis]
MDSPQPYRPQLYAVSVKGVCVQDGRVMLLKNEREEWELPGGKLDPGEAPMDCVVREIHEESGWPVDVATILDTWVYDEGRLNNTVLIVTYACVVNTDQPPVMSNEHKEIGLFTTEEVPGLNMPAGYKRSIAEWFARLSSPAPIG